MLVVIFRSRTRPGISENYDALAERMAAIAKSMPGFISYKDFQAGDGEHVSIHEWQTPEHLKAWREHPEHIAAQTLGREEFYEEYTLQVCDNPRESRFKR